MGAITSGGGVITGGAKHRGDWIRGWSSVAIGAVVGGLSSLGVAAACQDKESSITVLEHLKHYPLFSWRLWS